MAVDIEDQDLVLPLDDLDLEFDREKEGRRLGSALVSRIGKIDSGELRVAALLHDLRRSRVEDRILIIAHALDRVAKAREICNRTGPGNWRLEAEQSAATPLTGEVWNRRALDTERRRRSRSTKCREERW